jgi:hypothetical protein
VLSAVVRSGPVRTAVNGTLVARRWGRPVWSWPPSSILTRVGAALGRYCVGKAVTDGGVALLVASGRRYLRRSGPPRLAYSRNLKKTSDGVWLVRPGIGCSAVHSTCHLVAVGLVIVPMLISMVLSVLFFHSR